MTISVQLDGKLSQLAGGVSGTRVSTPAQTIRDALIQVARMFPSLHLFNCEGELRRIVRVQRNGQPAALSDAIQDGDLLLLSTG